MKILKKIYSYYVIFVVVSGFLATVPFMYLFVFFPNTRNINHWIYRVWGYWVFIFGFVRLRVEGKSNLKKGQPYIYCSNHTSYIDIPSLYCTIFSDIAFIGKASLGKVPLFGPIYSRVHILIDRKNRDSKQETVIRAKEAIDQGRSIIIFPEGTIPKVGKRPEMIDFKDGAFRMAIEKQVPIVPVSLPYNYYLLPDDGKIMANHYFCKVIFHEPIETIGMTEKDIITLKQKTFEAIQKGILENSIA
jgi:1-acyl-sn-glycerol-3-phosphate acyltransferase